MNTLVIGGSGGIGAGLVEVINESRQFGRVVATHHQSPGRQYAGVSWLELDLASQQSVTSAADTLLSSLSAIDLFICAAGYLHGDKGSPEKRLCCEAFIILKVGDFSISHGIIFSCSFFISI